MVDFQRNISLTPLTTLALPGRADYFFTLANEAQLPEMLAIAHKARLPITLLGGGSNTVVAGDVQGLVLLIAIKGIELVAEDADSVTINVSAGENWHGLVTHCLAKGWYGLENLALIPGSVGAAPVQNIGAYGMELSDRLVLVTMVDLASGKRRVLSAEECELDYRDSIFKHKLRNRVVITSIRLRLSKNPEINLSYGELAEALSPIADPHPRDLFDAVCALRRDKLPDPEALPNAGSFFKNPVVDVAKATELRERFPGIPCYLLNSGQVKIPAAWLIDKAGWKGCRKGNVGVHLRQALVIVHHGGGTGKELMALASEIAADIDKRYGIALEVEPVVVGNAQR